MCEFLNEVHAANPSLLNSYEKATTLASSMDGVLGRLKMFLVNNLDVITLVQSQELRELRDKGSVPT